jgi:hypothetical protein
MPYRVLNKDNVSVSGLQWGLAAIEMYVLGQAACHVSIFQGLMCGSDKLWLSSMDTGWG